MSWSSDSEKSHCDSTIRRTSSGRGGGSGWGEEDWVEGCDRSVLWAAEGMAVRVGREEGLWMVYGEL